MPDEINFSEAVIKQILKAMEEVITNSKNTDKENALKECRKLFEFRPTKENFELFAKVAATQTAEWKSFQSTVANSYRTFYESLKNAQLGGNQLPEDPTEKYDTWEAAKAAVAKEAAAKAAKAAVKIQAVFRGRKARKAAAVKAAAVQKAVSGLGGKLIMDNNNDKSLLLSDYEAFLNTLNKMNEKDCLSRFAEDRYKKLKIGIEIIEPTTVFEKSLVRDVSKAAFELYPGSDDSIKKFIIKLYKNAEGAKLSKATKYNYSEAMQAAIEALKNSSFMESQELKLNILEDIKDKFSEAQDAVIQHKLLELFKKVAGTHRRSGFSLFSEWRGKTSSLSAFEAKIEELNNNKELNHSNVPEKGKGG